MRLWVTACFLAIPALSVAQTSDAGLCAEFTRMEDDFSRRMPMQIDEITTVIQMKINCETKTQVFTRQLSVPQKYLAKGMNERKQRQHVQLHCNNEGMASVYKWTVIDNVYDKDYKLIAILKTSPNDCLNR